MVLLRALGVALGNWNAHRQEAELLCKRVFFLVRDIVAINSRGILLHGISEAGQSRRLRCLSRVCALPLLAGVPGESHALRETLLCSLGSFAKGRSCSDHDDDRH